MNARDEELYEQAEKYADVNFWGGAVWVEAFESKFAELIRADEREACAKVCLDWMEPFSGFNDYCKGGIDGLAKASNAIRARGNT